MGYTTSRSRVLKGRECARRRYWEYEYNASGLLYPGQSLRLETGIAIHKMLEQSLKGETIQAPPAQDYVPEPWEFHQGQTVREHKFFLDTVGEVVIPLLTQRLKRDFNILLTEGTHVPKLTDEVNWYSREDGILRHKVTDKRWIFSFKTCENYSPQRHFEPAAIAMQNVSEAWAADQEGYHDLAGSVMLWFEVGPLKPARQDGQFVRDSPFVRPYWDTKTQRAYWSYRYWGEDGKSHTIPRTAERRFIGELMPLSEWVEMLQRGEVIGQDFDEIMFGPVQFELNKDRQDSWLRQMRSEATGEPYWAGARGVVQHIFDDKDAGVTEWLDALDRFYPQNERQCNSFGGCPYFALCWGGSNSLLQIGSKFKLKKIRQSAAEDTEDD